MSLTVNAIPRYKGSSQLQNAGLTDDGTTLATSRHFTIAGNAIDSITAGITASTTQTQGQGAITTDINQVSTVANTNDTVTLPVPKAGMIILIMNDGTHTLQIFPSTGTNAGAGLNTAVTLATGKYARYIAISTTVWRVRAEN